MFGKIKLRKSDVLFSQIMRKKYPYCQVGTLIFGIECGGRLEVSHFYSRRHENTRFLEDNIDICCWRHHQYFHSHRTEYENWKLKKLGKKKFKQLELTKELYKKRDDKLDMLMLKKLYE